MRKKNRLNKLRMNLRLHLLVIPITILLMLSGSTAYSACKAEELSRNGAKLQKFGTRYTKNNTSYKVCRVFNGGLLWALEVHGCKVVRIREKYPENRLIRKMSRPEFRVTRKMSDQNYTRVNPNIISCKQIRLRI